MAGPGLLGRTFMDDEGAVGGGLLGLGPMSGSQKAAMLFAGLQDAFAGFQGRGPTNNLDQLAQQYGQQNYRQQVRKDRLDDKDAARKAEQDRREWELKNRQPDLKTAINPETNQMGQYYLDPTSRQPVWVQGVKLPGEAPKTRTKRVGMQDVMEEYDPISMKWNEVSRGAAFKPDAPSTDSSKPPAGYRWAGPPGQSNLVAIPGGPADSTGKNSKATDTQRLAALFANRAAASNNILGTTKDLKSGADVEGTKYFQKKFASDYFPGGNYINSGDFQKYDQAKRDFVNAVLRKESGAVIGKDEFDNAEKQYFPQPGDNPDVIEQKRANRELAVQGLRVAAGTAIGPEQQPAPAPSANKPPPAGTIRYDAQGNRI